MPVGFKLLSEADTSPQTKSECSLDSGLNCKNTVTILEYFYVYQKGIKIIKGKKIQMLSTYSEIILARLIWKSSEVHLANCDHHSMISWSRDFKTATKINKGSW